MPFTYRKLNASLPLNCSRTTGLPTRARISAARPLTNSWGPRRTTTDFRDDAISQVPHAWLTTHSHIDFAVKQPQCQCEAVGEMKAKRGVAPIHTLDGLT